VTISREIQGGRILPGKVFINYRRDDDQGSAGRLYDRLRAEFGDERLFMDVEGHIKGGDDFVDVLRAQVAECDVLLAIIGQRWLTVGDEAGGRRLDNPDDWVRVEIEGALETGKRVIPVLVGGAEIPRAESLPGSLRPLARRQAIRITPERFHADASGLVAQVKAALAEVEQARAAATEAERAVVAEAERRRQAEEAARLAERERQEAERARRQAIAGLAPSEIKSALELENWAFVKDKNDAAELRDHIARFAGGLTERFATERLASLVWAGLDRSDKAALQAFLDEFPKAREAGEAKAAFDSILAREAEERTAAEERARETADWADVAGSTDMAVFEAFLRVWPKGAHAADAEARMRELRGAGPFSRRALLKGAAYGIGGTATAVVAAYMVFEPGMPIWRLLHDRSIRTFTGHTGSVNAVAFAPDGGSCLSGSDDGTLKLWDVATGKELRTFTGHTGSFNPVTSVAFAPDGRSALSGSGDSRLRLWDLVTGSMLRAFGDHTALVTSVAIATDGHRAVSGEWDTLKLWDLATGSVLATLPAHTSGVRTVAFAPDGRTALSGSRDARLRLWNLATGGMLRTFARHKGSVNSVAIAPDGHDCLSGSQDGTLKLWDMANGEELRTFTGHTGAVNAAAFSPHGRTALSGASDATLKLWDVASGAVLRTFTGHTRGVSAVAFAPDGRTAVSGSWDRTLKLWDVTL
jgi:WD40 repeat protein